MRIAERELRQTKRGLDVLMKGVEEGRLHVKPYAFFYLRARLERYLWTPPGMLAVTIADNDAFCLDNYRFTYGQLCLLTGALKISVPSPTVLNYDTCGGTLKPFGTFLDPSPPGMQKLMKVLNFTF